jgi:hypothetical protein
LSQSRRERKGEFVCRLGISNAMNRVPIEESHSRRVIPQKAGIQGCVTKGLTHQTPTMWDIKVGAILVIARLW